VHRRRLGAVPLLTLAVLAAPLAPAYAGKPITLPPTDTDWDYQLGGARPAPGHAGIAEQCAQYSECGSYVDHYGRQVLAVEYHGKAFRKACRQWSDTIAVVRRDVDLTRHGVRRWC